MLRDPHDEFDAPLLEPVGLTYPQFLVLTRRVHVALTEAGRDMRVRLREVPACIERATGLSTEEIGGLQRQLRRVRARFGEVGG